MPTARDALLDAAFIALAQRPWSTVRMVDVAAAAGVSRQTLYNEFGSKDGLARALVRRETDTYLAGVDRALASARAPEDRLAAAAEWTVRAARGNALVRAVLTGFWSEWLPRAEPAAVRSRSSVPAQRRADAGPPTPTELLAQVRDRAATAINGPRAVCETAVRIALSYVLAPPPDAEGAGRLVRETVGGLSARSRTAGAR